MSFRDIWHPVRVLYLVAVALLMPTGANAAFQATIQPIQVCNDGGASCATVSFDETFLDTTFAQANMDIQVLPTTQFNSSKFLDVDASMNELNELLSAGADATATASRNTDSMVLNAWFVNSFDNSIAGNAVVAGNGLAMVNSGLNNIVLAHLLGHNFGLMHQADSANLMSLAIGGTQLTNAQIADIQNSQFVKVFDGTGGGTTGGTAVSEPPALLLFVGGLLLVLLCVRRGRRLDPVEAGVG